MATKTIGVSLGGLTLIFIALFCIGIGGGLLGSRIFQPTIPINSETKGTIVPVSQQITVSPSKLASDIVDSHKKSIFLLAYKNAKGMTAFGTGAALTNDGIIMSVVQADPGQQIIAIGENGSSFPVSISGTDELSGISFYKASNRIIPPLTLLQDTPQIGTSLLGLSRQSDTAFISVNAASLATFLLPKDTDAPGIQRLASVDSAQPMPGGTILLDENGSLAGILLHADHPTMLLASDVRAALDRFSSNQLSYNPFSMFGFTVSWKSNMDENNTLTIKSTVNTVAKNSPAERAGVKSGDMLSSIGGNAISWDTNIVNALHAQSIVLGITRQGQQRSIQITQ